MSTSKARHRPTILDVAAACGMSPATVSNVLAGKRHIAQETRALVLAKVSELGYVASATARALRMNRTWSVGVVVGDIANPFTPEVLHGIEDALWERHHNLILCSTGSQSDRKVAYLRNLIDKHVDGLILVAQRLTAHDAEELDIARLPPIVMINRKSDAISGDLVAIDSRGGMRALMTHLLSLGHRRIAFVKGLRDSSSAAERYRAYRAAMTGAKLVIDPALVVPGDYTIEAGTHAGALLAGMRQPPTAIVAANDLMAIGVLGALRDKGVSVPGDISVAGFDDIFLASHPLIGLTTVAQPKYNTGAIAARALLERIEQGRDLAPRFIGLDAELKVRGSTAAARGS
ncbi:LacI family DNA-binding transcriptional regulator [Caballeronia sp. LZ034LL]|uniref:LacI family DNA-binding transcriptional regulator n=1 Tax=Caballeronia sp. LZ034LL TaxID=3038567 RepID=UPI00285470A4|nr:LacI family DNA-binding transcriptional regulator [Caballeronia sp. LZ034LL]MDR5839106.1 LacI family DNA-binding transcriptional regulator [Caballeronia sp. LZ034LL]